MRKLVSQKEKGFSGYGCSACAWLHAYPRLTADGIEPRDDLNVAFLLHKCDENPSQKMIEDPPGLEEALAQNFTLKEV
jgi:hypothetical protein